MNAKILANGILRAVAILVLVALFLYFLYEIQSVLIYLVVALILTLIGNPILDFFKRRLKFKHIFATIATLLLFLFIIVGILLLFVPLIKSQGENLSLLNTSAIEKNSIELIGKISVFLENHNIDSAKMLKEFKISSKLNFPRLS
jgi:predicted PurR-regulated permease PerM